MLFEAFLHQISSMSLGYILYCTSVAFWGGGAIRGIFEPLGDGGHQEAADQAARGADGLSLAEQPRGVLHHGGLRSEGDARRSESVQELFRGPDSERHARR